MMSKLRICVLLWCLMPLIQSCASGGDSTVLDIHVSPVGSDSNPGTAKAPFASLERARDQVRNLKATGQLPAGGITIWLGGGVYQRDSSFVLTSEDSGTEMSPVLYRAVDGEDVRITGGKEVTFHPVTDDTILDRLDLAVRGRIVAADLSQAGISGFDQFGFQLANVGLDIRPLGLELFYDGVPMKLAQWPNEGWTRVTILPRGNLSGTIGYEGDRPSRWSRVDTILLYGFWAYDWFANYERVTLVDTDRKEIHTAYVPPPNPYGFVIGQPYRVLNVLEEIDEPSEWYFDVTSGIVYFYPPGPVEGIQTAVSLLDAPLISLQNTSYVSFRGITIECTRGCGVEIIGGSHNLVGGCCIRNIGTVGVAIGGMVSDIKWQMNFNTTFTNDAGAHNGVRGCDIYNTGMGGILLGGGNRMTLTKGNNYAVNNSIHDYSRWARTDHPAVYLYGVGNRVAHNSIYNGPHQAVVFWGNDHLIEYNDIHDVTLQVDDGGAIYTGRDFTQRGTIIRFNYVHELPAGVDGSHIGVYLDDFQSGTTVYGNVFRNVNLAVNVGGGRDNVVANNIFINCTRTVHIDARGLTWADYYFDGRKTTLYDRFIAVNGSSAPYSVAYPQLALLFDDSPATPKGNIVVNNLLFASRAPTFIEGADAFVVAYDNLLDPAPGLQELEQLEYDVKAWSSTVPAGIKSIPYRFIGLFRDEYRKSL